MIALTLHVPAALAWRIVQVTVVSVLFVFAGVSFRTGWLGRETPRPDMRA